MRAPKTESSSPAMISQLALGLSVEATKAETITRIAGLYREHKTMVKVAKALDVDITTLERWVRRVPDLKKAIDAVRSELHPRRA